MGIPFAGQVTQGDNADWLIMLHYREVTNGLFPHQSGRVFRPIGGS
jgi:hypothetical protein